jgi:DNA polymerase (family 10)
MEPDAMTDRLLRAIACPWVDVLGHPLGRVILKREPHRADMTRVIEAAAAGGVAMEINAQVDRLDLDDLHARRARDAGVKIVVSSDAHSAAALGNLRWGVNVARRAWLTREDVLNTRAVEDVRRMLRRSARRPPGQRPR